MWQGQQRAPLRGTLLLLLILWAHCSIRSNAQELDDQEDKKFGDKCSRTSECGFEGSVCDDITATCLCSPMLPVSNHIDKCGVAVRLNESCSFREQCEASNFQTDCKEGICVCRFGKVAVLKSDGQLECTTVIDTTPQQIYHVDPAMIGILVAMFLMFITICVVLRLFSRARWRENRTIFNTPNPRLMNASLLKENKHQQERRGSRTSRGPSRQPSMASLRPHSPVSQGLRRGSRGSSNASVSSNKSPPHPSNPNSSSTPMLESVTVEIQSKP